MMMSDFVVSSILDSGLMNYTFPLKIMCINYKAETELRAGAQRANGPVQKYAPAALADAKTK